MIDQGIFWGFGILITVLTVLVLIVFHCENRSCIESERKEREKDRKARR